MKINQFFKQPSFHLGEQVDSLVVLKNEGKPCEISRLHIQFILHVRCKENRQTEILIQQEFTDFQLAPNETKEYPIQYYLTEDLLISSSQVDYELVTEVVWEDGEKKIIADHVPILPPVPIITLMTALERLDLIKQSIDFDGNVQLFRYLSENQTLRFCDFAVVLTDQGVRLLMSHGHKKTTLHREITLAYHWMQDVQQLTAMMKRVLQPIGKPKAIRLTDLYQKWMHLAHVIGSYFSELKSLPRPFAVGRPMTDLDDLLVDIFDEDEDED